MILRRFRERLRAQDWFGVGVELAIVILGVFIGIQFSNWNEDRIAREQARIYRAEIVNEVGARVRSLDVMSAYYLQVRLHAIAALATLNAPRINNGEQFLVDAFQATQILPRPLRLDTFEQLRAAPVMNLVAPPPLQRRLANYDANVEGIQVTLSGITPYRDLARARMPFAVQEKIQAACGDQVTLIDRAAGVVTVTMPETCAPGMTRAEIDAGVAALRDAPGIWFVLNRQISDLDQKVKELHGTRERAANLARALARAAG